MLNEAKAVAGLQPVCGTITNKQLKSLNALYKMLQLKMLQYCQTGNYCLIDIVYPKMCIILAHIFFGKGKELLLKT